MKGDEVYTCKADNIIIATGASENTLAFPGWTLPGVMGAGSAQTQMNLHGVMPGKRVLMMGSGNVGLVVGLQLMQAGCELVAVVDAAPRVGGYGVHAAKLARTGVPFYLGHTILRAEGEDHVRKAVIAQVDKTWKPVPGTEKEFDVDTICVAVGLSPMYQLAMTAGCRLSDDPKKGGVHPVVNQFGETSVSGIFAARRCDGYRGGQVGHDFRAHRRGCRCPTGRLHQPGGARQALHIIPILAGSAASGNVCRGQ